MIECVQGNAGCLPAEDGYPVCVRDLSTKYNVLLIADEIQAGLGRAGYLVSNQKSGIKPDMDLRKVTLRRDPFASVVAIITLDITGEEKLVERCQILS